LTHYPFCYRAKGGESWFLVGSLVILLSTAAVTLHNGGCWVKGSNSSNRTTVTHFYCTYQDFGVISTENLDPNRTYIDLINLSLARNRIRDVKRDAFLHLEELEVLVLRGNLIRLLDEDLFSNLKLLQLLDLSFNRLSKLPDRLFSSQDRLETLPLQGNEALLHR
jgi:Leucine-rich repeat (LRR) protein